MMSFTGEPGGGPMRYPIAIEDMTCGIYATMGILGRFCAREKKNRAGQFIDRPFRFANLIGSRTLGKQLSERAVSPKRWGNAHQNIVPYEA